MKTQLSLIAILLLVPLYVQAEHQLPTLSVEGSAMRAGTFGATPDSSGLKDTASLLKRVPGANVNRNGPLTGIASYRGMFGNRINISVDGVNMKEVGSNSMDPPLSHIPAPLTEKLTVHQGISPVSSGIESFGGSMHVESKKGRFAKGDSIETNGTSSIGYGSVDDGYYGAFLGTLANKNHKLYLSGSDERGRDYKIKNKDRQRNTRYDREAFTVGYGYQRKGHKFGINYSNNNTGHTGTPALPMDIVYIRGGLYDANYAWDLGVGLKLRTNVFYQKMRHLMDNATLRSESERPNMKMQNQHMDKHMVAEEHGNMNHGANMQQDMNNNAMNAGHEAMGGMPAKEIEKMPEEEAGEYLENNYKKHGHHDMAMNMQNRTIVEAGGIDLALDIPLLDGTLTVGVNGDQSNHEAVSTMMNREEKFFNGVERDRYSIFTEWSGPISKQASLMLGARYVHTRSNADKVNPREMMKNGLLDSEHHPHDLVRQPLRHTLVSRKTTDYLNSIKMIDPTKSKKVDSASASASASAVDTSFTNLKTVKDQYEADKATNANTPKPNYKPLYDARKEAFAEARDAFGALDNKDKFENLSADGKYLRNINSNLHNEKILGARHSKAHSEEYTNQRKKINDVSKKINRQIVKRKKDAEKFNNVDRNRNFNEVDLAAVLRFVVNPELDVEIGLARKNRAPTYQELYLWTGSKATGGFADGKTYLGDLELELETAYQVDLGFDWHVADAYLVPRFFYHYVNDYIQGTPLSDKRKEETKADLKWSNIQAHFYGIDLEAGYTLTNNLRLDAGLNYVRGERINAPTSDGDLYRIAPLNGRAQLTYEQADWMSAIEGVFYADQGDVAGYNDEEKTKGWATLNLRGKYEPYYNLVVGVGVENVIDTKRFDHLGGYVNYNVNGRGKRVAMLGRNFYAILSYSW